MPPREVWARLQTRVDAAVAPGFSQLSQAGRTGPICRSLGLQTPGDGATATSYSARGPLPGPWRLLSCLGSPLPGPHQCPRTLPNAQGTSAPHWHGQSPWTSHLLSFTPKLLGEQHSALRQEGQHRPPLGTLVVGCPPVPEAVPRAEAGAGRASLLTQPTPCPESSALKVTPGLHPGPYSNSHPSCW